MRKIITIPILLAALALASCGTSAGPITPPPVVEQAVSNELPWWNDRAFYEVFVRSFYDSDGDGIGDLQGLIARLDYLNDGDPSTTTDLGITGIWLMPVTQSPSYHGYDTTDYFTIEEDYGTNEDFQQFIEEAHARGIAVIVDLVLNHTSNEHPWFVASREGDPGYADWYIWVDQDPGDENPWSGQPVFHPADGRYYFGLFWEGMPDLNYNNPEVTAEMEEVTRFWLEDMGVDGFRLDAVRHLIEDGSVIANSDGTLAWLTGYDDFIDSVDPDALTVGEIWDEPENVAPYVDGRVDIAFEFNLAESMVTSAAMRLSNPVFEAQQIALETYPTGQYAPFLTNHDQDRVMSQLGEDEGAARVAATMLLTAPGVPFIYYGEEIGMVGQKPDERIRTPMQWSDDPTTAGFTTGAPWEPLQSGVAAYNVATQADDPGSLLNHYRRLIALRNEHEALRRGATYLVASTNNHVYSLIRATDNEILLIVVNLSTVDVDDYVLTLPEGPLTTVSEGELLLGEGDLSLPTVNATGGFENYTPLPELPPQSSFVIRLLP